MLPKLCLVTPVALTLAFADPANLARSRQMLRELPVRFEPNAGQWNPRVKFTARTADCLIEFTAREASFGPIAMALVGSNPAPDIEGLDPLPARSSFFHGSRDRWRTNVANFSRLRYRAVYPGIDMVYYGGRDQLEYDFILAPGADPNRIRLRFRGASPTVIASGDLVLETAGARVIEKKPVVYQQDRTVAARYRLLDHDLVGIELASYDRSRPLTIDPVLVYSSLLGGAGSDVINAVKVDRNGFVWVAGYTNTGDLTATDDAYKTTSGGNRDAFIAKFDPTGSAGATLRYFTYFGGSGMDMATGLALDNIGHVYITGNTTSTDFPIWSVVLSNALKGSSQDIFVVKLTPAAGGADAIEYSTYFGGSDRDTAGGIDVDQGGNIYVVGTTRSNDLPLTPSATQNAQWGTQDAFVLKIDLRLNPPLAYASYLGGEALDEGRAIAVSPTGTVYIAGSTESINFPAAGFPFRNALQGDYDAFVTRMDLTKSGDDSVTYSTFLGGSKLDEARTIALDPSGKLLVGGYTLSSDFPTTLGTMQDSLAGNADGFVVRLDPDARGQSGLLYSTYLGGATGDSVYGIAGDAAGMIYATGYTLSPNFPVTSDAVTGSFGGGIEAFVVKIDPSKDASALLYSSYIGKAGTHIGYGIAVSGGLIFVGGSTAMQDILGSATAAQSAYGGGDSDGFLIVLGPS